MALKNAKITTRTLAILLVIIVVSFSGALLYFDYQVSFRDWELVSCHQIMDQLYANEAKLGAQVNSLNNQVATLKSNITSLESLQAPNVVMALGCTEIPSNSSYNANNPQTFDHLYITGTVTNEGLSTAYNAGLNVVAYDVNGNMILNITVPIAYGIYGNGESNLTPLSTIAPLQQVSLPGNGGIAIVHEGLANTWKITTVWTNTP